MLNYEQSNENIIFNDLLVYMHKLTAIICAFLDIVHRKKIVNSYESNRLTLTIDRIKSYGIKVVILK